MYDIDQLQGMQLADAAWHEVNTTTMWHCWHKAGILPDINTPTACPVVPILSLLNTDVSCNPEDLILNAEKQVKDVLNELKSTGSL
jgi:hypothetical protein